MSILVKSDITLRTARGVTDLALREIDDQQLIAEGEHRLRAGREVEFQLALPEANANLRGRAKIEKVVKLAVGPSRTKLQIVEMTTNHRGLLREWIDEQRRAMAVNRPTKKPPPPTIEEIRGARSASLASSLASSDSSIGRRAISEAITADPEHKTGRHSRLRSGVKARRGGRDAAGGANRKRRRVEVKVASGATPPIVMIRFNDPERYVAYYWKHLHRDAIQVRYDGAQLEKDTEVSVRLVLPGGSMVKCSGRVRVSSEAGFGIALDLIGTARATLRQSAGPRPRAL